MATLTMTEETDKETPLYYRYWGKAKPDADSDGPAYHLLPFHCLDVAAVADVWWASSQTLRQRFTRVIGADSEPQAKSWVMFFIALHDLGKLDIRFQCKAPHALKVLQPDVTHLSTEPYYHGPSGYSCFINELSLYGIGFIEEDAAIEWLQQVAGHHGVIPYDGDYVPPPSFGDDTIKAIIARDRQARIDWINALKQLFQVDFSALPENVPPMLAGFCSVCDWIGSSNEHFLYEKNPEIDLEDYLEARINPATQALAEFGILAKLRANQTLESLFFTSAGLPYKAHGLQTIIEKLPLEQNLTLIEAPTGSGKTEAALVYAARLLHEGSAESIIFALPTQATANAMLDRLESMARHLFKDGANVVLAHGKSGLHQTLNKIGRPTAQGQEEAGLQAVRWLTVSKKRAFLGQIGVCTVDQVLLSVLPGRHKFVRGFGIQKSVLIVDEVHAYDSYMYGLLGKVLDQQFQAGGSALLLSATLPQKQREYLAKNWGDARVEDTKFYPLITQIYTQKSPSLFAITNPEQLPERREVMLETWRLPEMQLDEDKLLAIITATAARQGAKIAIICNLVADAQALAQRLANPEINSDIAVDLFHSRFRFKDRQQIEESIKAWYGKEEKTRAQGGRILVATQVVEQSLDLDFDWLITQLCPVDLLFQRMGRLHRHQRARPEGFEQPRCVVLVPDQEQQYGNSQYVYENIRVLWRTEQLACQHASVVFPEAYRHWIEKVYQGPPWPGEAPEMTEAHDQYQREVEEVKCMIARTVAAYKANPLPDESDKATLLTRDGEMSLTVLPVLEQGKKFYTLAGEWLDKRDKAYWEQISLNSVSVPKSWESTLSGCKKEDGVFYLPMTVDDNGWLAELKDRRVIYRMDLGLFTVK
jgi:CRISPR-associated endonuclease/helicase Cas3